MTKSKSSASSTVVPSIFVVYLMNGAEFLNATLQILHAFLFCFVWIDQKMVYYRFYSFYRFMKSFWHLQSWNPAQKKSGSILTFGRHTTFTFCTKLCYNFMCFLCLVLSVVSVSNLIYLGHKCWVFWLFLLLYNISLASFRVLITLVDDTSFFDSGLWVIHANLII